MKSCQIMTVVGARPNFMKIAPLLREFSDHPGEFSTCLVHTGQHYDREMSEAFFRSLGLPDPDENLGIGSGSHAEQVGRTMIEFERVVRARRPDWVVVVGDVNATCACAITAKKEGVQLAHIEAGLRSNDWSMPEEINRIVADRLSDLLFTTDAFADGNLAREGVAPEKIHRVGNIMIDSLETHRARALERPVAAILEENLDGSTRGAHPTSFDPARYALLTLHRPANVDDRATLVALVEFLLTELVAEIPLVWPVHPRTRQRLQEFGLWQRLGSDGRVWIVRPLDYIDMLRLTMGAKLMLTDSGGLQEECCVVGVPCVTLRENTERPITLLENGGGSVLAGARVADIRRWSRAFLAHPPSGARPPLWDGQTARRIVAVFQGLR